jgi:hypothetical protein
MNIRIFNAAVLAIALFSLVSIVSSFAVITSRFEMEEPYEKSKEIVGITNKTNKPVFISGITDNPIRLSPHADGYIDITEAWSVNHDPTTAAVFPEIFQYTFSKQSGGAPFGTTTILINGESEKVKVIANIGSYNKIYNFDLSGIGDMAFMTTLMDDPTKPAGNFEKANFELLSVYDIGGARPRILGKIFSEEEKLSSEKMQREHKRLLEMPETEFKLEKIMELPSYKRQ